MHCDVVESNHFNRKALSPQIEGVCSARFPTHSTHCTHISAVVLNYIIFFQEINRYCMSVYEVIRLNRPHRNRINEGFDG